MIRAALYARVSTDEQVEKYGLPSQLHELRELAARRGYTIAGEPYVDDGYPGVDTDRPALTRLRDVVRARAVDVVMIHDPDRLARGPYLLLLVDELERAGVRVEFLTTPREDTPEGRMLLGMKGLFGDYERLKTKERTRRGRLEKSRQGGVVLGRCPYGYRFTGPRHGQLEVVETEAATVRMMYAWLVDEQRSLRSIALELRALGVPAPRGPRWTPASVRRIFTSRTYMGEQIQNRWKLVPSPKTGRRTHATLRPAAEWIIVPVPAIVTPERFAQAQARLAKNAALLVGRPGRRYLLRGLLRCVGCSHRLVGAAERRVFFYYVCPRNDRIHGETRCPGRRVRAEAIETLVWETVAGILRHPEILTEQLARHRDRLGVREVEVRSAVVDLERQLAEVARQEHRLLDLYVDEQLRTDAVKDRLSELARRRTGLREQHTRARQQAAASGAAEADHGAIARYCAAARRGIEQLTAEGRQRLLQLLLERVVVRGRDVTLHGLLPAGKSSATRRDADQYPARFELTVTLPERRRS